MKVLFGIVFDMLFSELDKIMVNKVNFLDFRVSDRPPPRKCDLFGRLSEKRKSMPLLCVAPPQKSIFCCADFGSAIALDLQQKLKPFLHSSKKQLLLQSFLGIYSFFV